MTAEFGSSGISVAGTSDRDQRAEACRYPVHYFSRVAEMAIIQVGQESKRRGDLPQARMYRRSGHRLLDDCGKLMHLRTGADIDL